MSLPWLQNCVGGRLSDEDMKNIPNPTLELGIHVVMKNVQAFSLLGLLFVGPAVALIRKKPVGKTAFSAAKYGALLGCGTGPLMTYAKVKNLEEEGIYDRCFRLRHNRGQVRVDQLSIAGGVGGIASALLMGQAAVASSGAVGMVLGVLTGGFYNNVIAKKSS